MLKIKVSKIQADTVPMVGWRTGRFFVKVMVNGNVEKTIIAIADSGWALWEDEFHFDTSHTSVITLTLLATHRVREDTVVGWNEEAINSSLWDSKSVERRLHSDTGTLNTHLHFTLELLSQDAPCAAKRQEASNAVRNRNVYDLRTGIQVAMGAEMGAANPTGAARHARHVLAFGDEPRNPISEILDLGDIDSVSETWDLLLKHVEVFTKIVSRFSEIHPYAKFACSVLTMAQKVAVAQQERDDKFRELIKITTDVFCFLNELKVAALEGHRQTIMLLTLQTTECAYFIRDYTKQKRSFIIRAAKNVISGDAIERKIAEYEKKFQDLKVAFRDGAALNIEIAVVRIAEQVDRIATAGELDDLPYAQGARFDLRKQCLLGTREELLEKIFEWVNNADVDTPRVLVLNGVAGSGKSAIAHSVSRRFNEMRRLGSSFFFLPDRPERSPDKLFSTITRDLADLDPQWKEALKQNIGARAVRNTSCVLEQFEEFIIKPAASSVYFGPVVIVIDALDATGDPSMRKDLVSLLSMRTADFPSNFRILITARPEPDICHAFNDQKGVHWWDIQKVVDKQSTLDDIADFFDSELSDFAGLKWSERYCRKMTTKSEGDFGWAAFACAFIKELGAAQPPSERMSQLLSRPKGITVDDEDVSDVDCQGSFAFFRDKLHIPHLGPGAHKPSNAHGNSHLNPHVALKDPGPGLGFPAPLLPSNGQGPHGPWYFPGSGHPY